MALLNRDTLRNLFGKGSRPTEAHFSDLIDSFINKVDDGFAKSPEGGLSLAPGEGESKVLSYYQGPKDRHAEWHTSLDPEPGAHGLNFEEFGGESVLFLRRRGNVGIGTLQPAHKLEVGGMMAMKERRGTYAVGQVPADGYWHSILTDLNDLQAFEIMASVSRPARRDGKLPRSSVAHALALSAFGGLGARNKIRTTQFGWYWNRLRFRWLGKTHEYDLQIRSFFNFGTIKTGIKKGQPVMIDYKICRLWGEDHVPVEGPVGMKP